MQQTMQNNARCGVLHYIKITTLANPHFECRMDEHIVRQMGSGVKRASLK